MPLLRFLALFCLLPVAAPAFPAQPMDRVMAAAEPDGTAPPATVPTAPATVPTPPTAVPTAPATPPDRSAEPAAELPATAEPKRDQPIDIRDDLTRLPTIDLTTPPDDLWQRIRNGFAMPDLDSPLVSDRQAWYLNHADMLARILERSRRYLYYIVGELERRGMPTELALLPIVESAYNPMALSPARAMGMWQFIPSTGKNYRLQQNWWLDERRDIVASTNAALDYLQDIYEMNGDWQLALASYNWGEHAVARAVARNKAKGLRTDYAHLSMPGETRYYVPKLQALKNIVAHPEIFHIRLDPLPNRPYFSVVDQPATMDVSLAAKLAEIPVEEFIALNPAYHRPVMPAGKGSGLVLPADKVDTFTSNLERHTGEDRPLSTWQTYTLKHGEKIDSVAARYGISGARLRQINGITRRTHVGPGFALLVPGRESQAHAGLIAAKLPQVAADPPARGVRHKRHKAGKGSAGHKHAAGGARKKAGKRKQR